jgi:formylglycine-generating enzyme required for sulfatase activity
MARNNYGSLSGRRSGGAAWQWIFIGGIFGFGCAAIILFVGIISGVLSVGGTSVANLPTQTAFIITATAAPVTPTIPPTEVIVTEPPLSVLAPTASPTILPTLLTLAPTLPPTTQVQPTTGAGATTTGSTTVAGATPNVNNATAGRFDRVAAIASELVPIAGGQFAMGTTAGEVAAAVAECTGGYGGEAGTCQPSDGEDSFPQHNVTVSPFQMEVTEVTYQQYLTFLNSMGAGSHRNGCLGQPCIQTLSDSETSNVTFDSQNYSVNAAIVDFPVTNVTWYGAQAYCQSIGRRLPTEAEWERAARGDLGYVYPWSNEWSPDNSATRRSTTEEKVSVGTFSEVFSPYGVLNLAGNAAEWVSDWYSPNFYSRPEAAGPDPAGPATGTEKVTRGGSWDTVPFYTRTVHRQSRDPLSPTAAIGFRCVADANSGANANAGLPLGANAAAGTPDPAALGIVPAGDEETTANATTPAVPGVDNNAAPTMPAAPTTPAPVMTNTPAVQGTLVPGG